MKVVMKLLSRFFVILITVGMLSARCKPDRIDPIVNTFKKLVDLKGVTIEDIYGLYQRSDGNYAILLRVSGLTGIPASGVLDKNGNLIGNLTSHPSIGGNVKEAISDGDNGFILIGYSIGASSPYVARISKDQTILFNKSINKYDPNAVGYDVRAVALSQTSEIGIVGGYHAGNFMNWGSGFAQYNIDGTGFPVSSKTENDNIIPYAIATTLNGDYIVVGSSAVFSRGYIMFFYDIGVRYKKVEFSGKPMYEIRQLNMALLHKDNYVILYGTNGNAHLLGIDINLQELWDINENDFLPDATNFSLIESDFEGNVVVCAQQDKQFFLVGISGSNGEEIWRSSKPFTLTGEDLYPRKMCVAQDQGVLAACNIATNLFLIKTDKYGEVHE